jgi:hypothetical protein
MIETIELFPELTDKLIGLLRNIKYDDWKKPSPIKGRTVQDLVAHLIDGSLRRLSLQRDGHSSDKIKVNLNSYTDLINYIQNLNTTWMDTTDRLSPRILIDLLKYSENELIDFLKTLNPMERAIFSVQWAGEEESENWFDIAREYTEKWHHQMQIRLALDRPLLMDKKYIEPLYDTFMLGLPHLYKEMTNYKIGETLKITVIGKLNKSWCLIKQSDKWVFNELITNVNTQIDISEDDAWMIFTNTDRDKEKYKSRIKTRGDSKLGNRLIDFVTVLS